MTRTEADDVLAVIDSFGLTRPILVGDSIAGQEMSLLGRLVRVPTLASKIKEVLREWLLPALEHETRQRRLKQ